MVNIKNYKITIFGDSVPKGVFIDSGKIIKIDKNAINYIDEHFDIQIDNKSVFGQTLKRVYDKGLIDNYLNTINPNDKNTLIISLGGNDCDFDWKSVAENPDIYHTSRTNIEEFTFCLEDIIKKVSKHNVHLIFTNLFPIDSKRYFDNIITKSYNRENILKFLNNDISNLSRHQECYNDIILKIASKYEIEVMDIRSQFLLNTHFLENISLDGIHPNAEGQKEIGLILIKQITKLIENEN